MIKHFIKTIFIIVLSAMLLASCGNEEPTNPTNKVYSSVDYTKEQLDSSKYDVEKYTTPFWEGNIVYNECVFPIYSKNGVLKPINLTYNASEIVSVKNYALDIEYEEGKDYYLENGNLVIIPNGDIELVGYSYIHREGIPEIEYNDLLINKDHTGTEYFTPTSLIANKALVVTYVHNDSWPLEIPQSDKKDLKRTLKRLKKKKDTTIVVTGDSISVGYSSSKIENIPPYADSYVDMVDKILTDKYDNPNIKIVNSSIGGSTASFSYEDLDKTVIQYKPSLVIINYGMNEGLSDISVEEYKNNINDRIDYIKNKIPNCEILLVTPLVANPNIYDIDLFKLYAESLYAIKKEWKGVAVCDPQYILTGLMEQVNKDYLCFSYDNLAHPNDYGMRIIAQCVLEVLTE